MRVVRTERSDRRPDTFFYAGNPPVMGDQVSTPYEEGKVVETMEQQVPGMEGAKRYIRIQTPSKSSHWFELCCITDSNPELVATAQEEVAPPQDDPETNLIAFANRRFNDLIREKNEWLAQRCGELGYSSVWYMADPGYQEQKGFRDALVLAKYIIREVQSDLRPCRRCGVLFRDHPCLKCPDGKGYFEEGVK